MAAMEEMQLVVTPRDAAILGRTGHECNPDFTPPGPKNEVMIESMQHILDRFVFCPLGQLESDYGPKRVHYENFSVGAVTALVTYLKLPENYWLVAFGCTEDETTYRFVLRVIAPEAATNGAEKVAKRVVAVGSDPVTTAAEVAEGGIGITCLTTAVLTRAITKWQDTPLDIAMVNAEPKTGPSNAKLRSSPEMLALNDAIIGACARRASDAIRAWGATPTDRRHRELVALTESLKLLAIGSTKRCRPSHPQHRRDARGLVRYYDHGMELQAKNERIRVLEERIRCSNKEIKRLKKADEKHRQKASSSTSPR
jgi:hypothetical protein